MDSSPKRLWLAVSRAGQPRKGPLGPLCTQHRGLRFPSHCPSPAGNWAREFSHHLKPEISVHSGAERDLSEHSAQLLNMLSQPRSSAMLRVAFVGWAPLKAAHLTADGACQTQATKPATPELLTQRRSRDTGPVLPEALFNSITPTTSSVTQLHATCQDTRPSAEHGCHCDGQLSLAPRTQNREGARRQVSQEQLLLHLREK